MIRIAIKGSLAGVALGLAALMTAGCADQQPTRTVSPTELETTSLDDLAVSGKLEQQPGKKEHYEMQRVIVSLAATNTPVSDQVAALSKKYPNARTVRVLSSFRQVVLEMPLSDIKLLEHEPEVEQVSPDRQNQPSN